MNGFQYAVAAWLPIVIFPQTMAPDFRYGFPATFGLVIAALISVVGIHFFHLRDIRLGKAAVPIDSEIDSEGEPDQNPGDSKQSSNYSKTRRVDAEV